MTSRIDSGEDFTNRLARVTSVAQHADVTLADFDDLIRRSRDPIDGTTRAVLTRMVLLEIGVRLFGPLSGQTAGQTHLNRWES